uniref:Mesocentin-like n=1 Tax=Saccoglossus kowalevskii TaxID=10224 RepID=A0ABM0GXH1_SACKO|nr:PREDICTED: mesocentin-like [Saccoglossus kowalevskii]
MPFQAYTSSKFAHRSDRNSVVANAMENLSTCFVIMCMVGLGFAADVNLKQDLLAPTDVIATVLSLRRVKLKWTDPMTFDHAKTYTVEYRQLYPTESGITNVEVDQQEVTIKGLQSFARYEFKIAAHNDEGVGLQCDPVYATTMMEGDGYAPIVSPVVVDVRDKDSVNNIVNVDVVVRVTSARGYEPTGLMVFYSDDTSPDSSYLSWPIVRVDVDINVEVIIPVTGLLPNHSYKFITQTYNMRGGSPKSEPFSYTTPMNGDGDIVPSPPTDVVVRLITSESIKIEWKSPEEGLPITGYEVYWTNEMDAPVEEWSMLEASSSVTSLELTALFSDTVYFIKVQARNDFGVGPMSMVRVSTSPAPVPTEVPIKYGMCPDMSNSRFCVESCSYHNDCPGRQLCCYNGCARICTDGQPILPAPIKELTCPPFADPPNGVAVCDGGVVGSTCRYSCDEGYIHSEADASKMVRTCGSDGQWSGEQITCVQDVIDGPPLAPNILSIEDVSINGDETRSVSLVWRAPSQFDPDITGYVVHYTEDVDAQYSQWININIPSDTTTYIITHLKPDTTYNFKIRALNKFGLSKASESVRYRTKATQMVKKTGKCPAFVEGRGCQENCFSNEECPGNQVCCYNGCGRVCVDPEEEIIQPAAEEYIYAGCYMTPDPALEKDAALYKPIEGTISVKQRSTGGNIDIILDLSGFDASSRHGFHVHTYGYIDGMTGCSASNTGQHYNPQFKTHGAPGDSERHVGDLGNIESDENGNVKTVIRDDVASLVGPDSILGRSFVIHAGVDDLGQGEDEGSHSTGNAGARIACCAIGWMPSLENE